MKNSLRIALCAVVSASVPAVPTYAMARVNAHHTATHATKSRDYHSYHFQRKHIYVNHQLIASPLGFTHAHTIYIPFSTISQILTKMHVQNAWSGSKWNLRVPPSFPIALKEIAPPSKNNVVYVNGTPVVGFVTIYYRDPRTKHLAPYVPAQAVEKVLQQIGISDKWSGSAWFLEVKQTPPVYIAFDKTGSKVETDTSLAAAEAALQADPGGKVADAAGKTLFVEPDFAAFSAPNGTSQEYTTQGAASAAIKEDSLGYVVDLNAGQVVVFPKNTYSLSSTGDWTSTAYGWQGVEHPTFAEPLSTYVALDANPGHSPHFTQWFQLAQNQNEYVGHMAGAWENPYRTVDLSQTAPSSVTAQQMDGWLTQQASPLQGLGASFLAAQTHFGVDATYLLSHAILESNWGKSAIATAKDNLFGYGAYDANPGSDAGVFPSDDYAIQFQAWEVKNSYLSPTGSFFYQSPTLDGMNEHYATDPNWANSVAVMMSEYVHSAGGLASDYPQVSSNSAPTSPSNSSAGTSSAAGAAAGQDEPVFWLNGATGTVLANPYGALPLYPDMQTGEAQMFPGTLQIGSTGSTVVQLQRQLNANGATLTVDGQYGPMTSGAVKAYQQTIRKNTPTTSIMPTGICDGATWVSLFPANALPSVSTGGSVSVDEMKQGMLGGFVIEWYHITSGAAEGWTPASSISLQNVYRIQPAQGDNVSVYGSDGQTVVTSLHVGDEVVCLNQTPNSTGLLQIQFDEPGTDTAVVGYVKSTEASLAPVHS